MAIESLPIQPHIGSTFEWNTITHRVEFGDGFSERVTDGPQEFRDAWDLVFKNLTQERAQALGQFIRNHGSRTVFRWAPPWDAGFDDDDTYEDPMTKNRFKEKLWTFVAGTLRQEAQVGEGANRIVTGNLRRAALMRISVRIIQEFDLI